MKMIFTVVFFIFLIACSSEVILPDRESLIPSDAVKMSPVLDAAPVMSLSSDYADPSPLPYPVNTAGAEDSPFVLPEGLYFFFTPDVRVPVEKQVIDGVTGIYFAKNIDGVLQRPERVLLQDFGKAGLDGCEFVRDGVMYFCTVREGFSGIHWFKANFVDGVWQDWRLADSELKTDEYETGELHISSEGNELYFHSGRAGGKGGNDIWVSKLVDGVWGVPQNVAAVNTDRDDGYPALSPDGSELWISRDFAVWRSKRADGEWQVPEKMFSPLAGEVSIDGAGNVYFVHHFFKADKMIEADIYFAKKN